MKPVAPQFIVTKAKQTLMRWRAGLLSARRSRVKGILTLNIGYRWRLISKDQGHHWHLLSHSNYNHQL